MKNAFHEKNKWLNRWFDCITPWTVNTLPSFGREVWLSCYGVPVHTWNVTTFLNIGKLWGEVIQIEEDTARGEHYDIGKVKVFSYVSSNINQPMKLKVGNTSFQIRVAEEQAVFIGDSHFSCMCACHGLVDEQTSSAKSGGQDDDVEGRSDCNSLGPKEDGKFSFIAETNLEDIENIDKEGPMRSLCEEEMRGCGLDPEKSMNRGNHYLSLCGQPGTSDGLEVYPQALRDGLSGRRELEGAGFAGSCLGADASSQHDQAAIEQDEFIQELHLTRLEYGASILFNYISIWFLELVCVASVEVVCYDLLGSHRGTRRFLADTGLDGLGLGVGVLCVSCIGKITGELCSAYEVRLLRMISVCSARSWLFIRCATSKLIAVQRCSLA
ncbi:hypothetical protein Dimus_027185 [Dionaea muscipula]